MTCIARTRVGTWDGLAAVDIGSRSGLSVRNPVVVPAESAPPISAPTWVATALHIGLVAHRASGVGCVRDGAGGLGAANIAVDLDCRGWGW